MYRFPFLVLTLEFCFPNFDCCLPKPHKIIFLNKEKREDTHLNLASLVLAMYKLKLIQCDVGVIF